MRIKVKSLQDFQKRTQYIRQNTNLPILANLKIDWHPSTGVTITKNNINCVCVMLLPGAEPNTPDGTLLVDERVLMGYITKCKPDEWLMLTAGERVTASSPGRPDVHISLEDPTNYPPTPDYRTAESNFTLEVEHLDAIRIASNFTTDNEAAGNMQFVHVGGQFIAGIHTHYFYVNARFKDLPPMLLNNAQAAIVVGTTSAGERVEFASQGNHYFFLTGDTVYIFTRMEGKTPNLPMLIDRLKLPGKSFTIAREPVVDFCDTSNLATEKPISDCALLPNGLFATFRMVDADYNRGSDYDIPVTGELEQFNFNSRLVGPTLRLVPYETLLAKANQNNLIITAPDEQEWFCFLGMQKT